MCDTWWIPPVVHCPGDLSVITGSNDCQWRHDGRTSSIKNIYRASAVYKIYLSLFIKAFKSDGVIYIYENITITVRPWRHAKPFRVCLLRTGNVWLMSWIKATWWASNDRIRFGGRCSLLWCNNNNNWAPRLWWACSQVVGVPILLLSCLIINFLSFFLFLLFFWFSLHFISICHLFCFDGRAEPIIITIRLQAGRHSLSLSPAASSWTATTTTATTNPPSATNLNNWTCLPAMYSLYCC